MNRDIEPSFFGVECTGPNAEKARRLRDEAEARLLLADFYELTRKSQLVIAAATEEIRMKRE